MIYQAYWALEDAGAKSESSTTRPGTPEKIDCFQSFYASLTSKPPAVKLIVFLKDAHDASLENLQAIAETDKKLIPPARW